MVSPRRRSVHGPPRVDPGPHLRRRLPDREPRQRRGHLHGLSFKLTATDGGYVPESAQYPETTVLVRSAARVIEFVSDEPGDRGIHCHMTHHVVT